MHPENQIKSFFKERKKERKEVLPWSILAIARRVFS